jgi:hypothetical protein
MQQHNNVLIKTDHKYCLLTQESSCFDGRLVRVGALRLPFILGTGLLLLLLGGRRALFQALLGGAGVC